MAHRRRHETQTGRTRGSDGSEHPVAARVDPGAGAGPRTETSPDSELADDVVATVSGGVPQMRTRAQLLRLLSHRVLLNRATLRALVALVAVVTFLVFSDKSADAVGTAIGAGLLASAALDLWSRRLAVRHEMGEPVPALRIAVQIAFGGLLLLWPGATIQVVDVAVGAFLVGHALFDLVAAIRNRSDDRAWSALRGALTLAVGLIAIIFGNFLATLLALGVAAVWILSGAIAVVYVLHGGNLGLFREVDPASSYKIVRGFVQAHELESHERSRLTEKLFFEGSAFRARLVRFTILLFLSVAIATFGVLQDSTAVVIGAMLIAPLMTPIMATAAALTMAWPRRALAAGLTVLFGTVFAIATAWVLTAAVPNVIDPLQSSQVTSRIEPRLLDLSIALAAGAAGAFALTREDVSDSLPGVAIAVALVPPLSVVGVSIEAGSLGDAGGAFLLYLTNLVAILLAGGVVFVLTGYTPLYRIEQEHERVRRSMAGVAFGVLIIIIPLAATGHEIATEALSLDEANHAVESWLGRDTEFVVEHVDVDDSEVTVTIAGPGEAPSPQDLADELGERLDREVVLDLRVVPELRTEVSSSR